MKRAIALLAILMMCGIAHPSDPAPASQEKNEHAVWLRVRNATGLDLAAVQLNKHYSFGDLAKGAVSEYLKVEGMYRYSYAEALAGKRKLVCQPRDYMGETLLPPGHYTYTIAVSGDSLDISCAADP